MLTEARSDATAPRDAAPLREAYELLDALTWRRVFPDEPTPETRDLVVMRMTVSHIRRLLVALSAAPPDPAPAAPRDAAPLREAAGAAFEAINAMHGDLGPDNDAPWHKHEDVWRALGKALT